MEEKNPFLEYKELTIETQEEIKDLESQISTLKKKVSEMKSKCTHKNIDGSSAIVKDGWDFGSDRYIYVCSICNTHA